MAFHKLQVHKLQFQSSSAIKLCTAGGLYFLSGYSLLLMIYIDLRVIGDFWLIYVF